MLNAFRLLADLSHVLAIVLLLLKITRTKSVAGISLRAQALFATVFLTRYVDLLWNHSSLYNTVMKVIFITTSLYTCYLIAVRFRATYDNAKHDTLRVEYILVPCAILALVLNEEFTPFEIVWAFSIYLEAVAIMPQLFMLARSGEAETITAHYLFALGSYRGLYVLNWVYRYWYEGHVDWVAWIAGFVQTALYADFFYIYITKVLRGQKFELPK